MRRRAYQPSAHLCGAHEDFRPMLGVEELCVAHEFPRPQTRNYPAVRIGKNETLDRLETSFLQECVTARSLRPDSGDLLDEIRARDIVEIGVESRANLRSHGTNKRNVRVARPLEGSGC